MGTANPAATWLDCGSLLFVDLARKARPQCRYFEFDSKIYWKYGGEGGIRTHGTLSRTHAFQACALNHSATSPSSQHTGGKAVCGLSERTPTKICLANAQLVALNHQDDLCTSPSRQHTGGIAV